MVTKFDYNTQEVNVCLSVMIELLTILGKYRNNIVLVGGWVPYFLLIEKGREHTGSIDIDLALDFNKISDDSYKTILQLLKKHEYKQGNQPFIFNRIIQSNDKTKYTIEIDLLSGEYGGTGRSHRTQKIQDIHARKSRGCDLVFQYNFTYLLKKEMPDGSVNELRIKIADVIPFLVMKGMALWERYKEKDAYDIYFTILHYNGGVNKIIKIFDPVKSNNLIKEGLGKIRAKFDDINAIGPSWIVKFLEIQDKEEADRIKRDAYERINFFLEKIGIEKFKDNLKA
jgi:hypothetical protein